MLGTVCIRSAVLQAMVIESSTANQISAET